MIDIHPTATVSELKQKIHDKEGILPEQQNLSIFGTQKPLQVENCALCDYGIHNGSRINMAYRLRAEVGNLDESASVEL